MITNIEMILKDKALDEDTVIKFRRQDTNRFELDIIGKMGISNFALSGSQMVDFKACLDMISYEETN